LWCCPHRKTAPTTSRRSACGSSTKSPPFNASSPAPTSGARSCRSTLAPHGPTMRQASPRKASSHRSQADEPTRSSRTMNNNVVLKLREFGGTLLTWRQYRAKPSTEGTCNDYYVGSKRTRSAEHSSFESEDIV